MPRSPRVTLEEAQEKLKLDGIKEIEGIIAKACALVENQAVPLRTAAAAGVSVKNVRSFLASKKAGRRPNKRGRPPMLRESFYSK